MTRLVTWLEDMQVCSWGSALGLEERGYFKLSCNVIS